MRRRLVSRTSEPSGRLHSASTSGRPDLSERRSEQHIARQPVELASVLTLADGEKVAATVIDLSSSGCRIQIPVTLEPGELVQLTIGEFAIDSEVKWFSGGTGGLSFNLGPGVASDPADVRKGGRIRTSMKATMQRHGKPRFEIRVVDMSVQGCKVEFADRPDVGERVHMRFEGLAPIEGEVCWVSAVEAGIHFEATIHSAVFDLLLERSP